MCEDRILRMKRDVRLAKRRARRLRQLTNYLTQPSHAAPSPATSAASSSDSEDSQPPAASPLAPRGRKPEPCHANLHEIALRTVHLMRQNVEIQRRVEELKKETTAFVISVMKEPANRWRYERYMTPFVTPPESAASSDDARSLPDLDDGDANDAHDVALRER